MKIKVELDQMMDFFPVTPGTHRWIQENDLTMEIPDKLWQEYREVNERFSELHGKFEQLYRVQEGMEPYDVPSVPEHTLIRGK